MIRSKLRKQAKIQDLFIQVPIGDLCKPFALFLKCLQDQRIKFQRSNISNNTINFYTCRQKKSIEFNNTIIEKLPTFQFELTVIYFNQENQKIPSNPPQRKTLIIRQGLDIQFSLLYDIEETISDQQTIIYLCDLSSSVLNSIYDKQLQFYDQKTDQLAKDTQQSILGNIWTNIIYQIPGIGPDKCKAIVRSFPTYQSILKDFQGQQKLANLEIIRGSKTSKLGKSLANRIYKVMTSIKGHQQLI